MAAGVRPGPESAPNCRVYAYLWGTEYDASRAGWNSLACQQIQVTPSGVFTAWGSRTVADRAGVSGAAAYDRVRFGEGGGGVLLADGRVLLLPGTYSDLLECRIWDPATDAYTAAPELAEVPAIGLGAYLGGCVIPDGRMVFTPWYSRHLVVGKPGLGVSYGRDIALAGFWNRRP